MSIRITGIHFDPDPYRFVADLLTLRDKHDWLGDEVDSLIAKLTVRVLETACVLGARSVERDGDSGSGPNAPHMPLLAVDLDPTATLKDSGGDVAPDHFQVGIGMQSDAVARPVVEPCSFSHTGTVSTPMVTIVMSPETCPDAVARLVQHLASGLS